MVIQSSCSGLCNKKIINFKMMMMIMCSWIVLFGGDGEDHTSSQYRGVGILLMLFGDNASGEHEDFVSCKHNSITLMVFADGNDLVSCKHKSSHPPSLLFSASSRLT